MRIVVDTNHRPIGTTLGWSAAALVDLARERSLTLCISLILLAELAEVITRDKFAHRIQLAGLFAAEFVQDYRRLAYIVEPQPLSVPTCRDPDDDHVLACAIAARADLIVTRDLDLLDLKTFQNIPILAAADALRSIEAQH